MSGHWYAGKQAGRQASKQWKQWKQTDTKREAHAPVRCLVGRLQSLKMMTRSKALVVKPARSKCTCSISEMVTTKKGVSVRLTRACVVGWISTISRDTLAEKPDLRNGTSTLRAKS